MDWRNFILRNKVAAAFALGALYIGAYALLLLLIEAQDEDNDRLAALRWENGRLIARLTTQAPNAPASDDRGPA